MQKDNFPHWDKQRHGFYEVWYLKLNLPSDGALVGPALWLRFTTLSARNGLKKVAEVWAIFFDPQAGGGSQKVAIKNTCSLGSYATNSDGSVAIEDSFFGADRTSGTTIGRGHRIEWDLKFEPNSYTFFHVPDTLQKLKLTKSVVCKPNVDIRFTGWFTVNGKRFDVSAAPGCQGHIWGKKYAHDWAWAHCNSFEGGSPAVLEALSARVKLGGVVTSPQMSALFFEYKGERHEFNRLSDAFAIRSEYGLTNWKFSVDRGPLRLLGEISCDVKDLIAVTYEDTQGSYLYCNNSELASMSLSVYYRGKLDATLRSRCTTGFETVARERSPYVEVLL
ncbi:MAG: hypothetical protein HY075_11430 [Deltaproteobacteria bacterium]|nr:hypothetical protein [Deltaproteobacteria bacterium]